MNVFESKGDQVVYLAVTAVAGVVEFEQVENG